MAQLARRVFYAQYRGLLGVEAPLACAVHPGRISFVKIETGR